MTVYERAKTYVLGQVDRAAFAAEEQQVRAELRRAGWRIDEVEPPEDVEMRFITRNSSDPEDGGWNHSFTVHIGGVAPERLQLLRDLGLRPISGAIWAYFNPHGADHFELQGAKMAAHLAATPEERRAHYAENYIYDADCSNEAAVAFYERNNTYDVAQQHLAKLRAAGVL